MVRVGLTDSAGGTVEQFTIGRDLTPSGKIKLEGKGVVPTVKGRSTGSEGSRRQIDWPLGGS